MYLCMPYVNIRITKAAMYIEQVRVYTVSASVIQNVCMVCELIWL